MTELEEKLRKVEAERQLVVDRLTESRCQLSLSQSKCQELTASGALKVDREEYDRVVSEYKM